MIKRLPPKLKRFPAAKQRRLDQLLEKNSDGTISSAEKERLTQLVAEAEQLMVTNSKLLVEYAQQQTSHPPPNAVPLTVWVAEEHAGP